MATNKYFNNFSAVKTNEMRMYEDLLTESIRIHGHDIYYMPREQWDTTDQIFGENLQSVFQRAYQMEMYIANVEGYEGDGDFFSKFGLEIRENTNFVLAKRTFEKYMPASIAIRPREGDLLFIPVMNKVMEIKFIEDELLFFAKGWKLPYVYELRCETFRFGNEKFDTGIEQLDQIDKNFVYTIELALAGTGNYNIGETVYQGANLSSATATALVSDWDSNAKKIKIAEIKGTFATSSTLVGNSSNTRMTVTTADTFGTNPYYDLFDNKKIQDEVTDFIDLSETNPFGNP